jgi:hypothetical protein
MDRRKENMMALLNPLNPELYRRLVAVFGRVKLANDGQQAIIRYAPDHTYRQGRDKAIVISWGETYSVDCPFCLDTRQRLYFSHTWGQKDVRTGDDMLFVVHCHNEPCLSTRARQKELHAIVYPFGRWADKVDVTVRPVKPPVVVAPAKIVLPQTKSLKDLHQLDPALRYLKKRGFDPAHLAAGDRMLYCYEDLTSNPPIRAPRLVIPIYMPSAVQPLSNSFAPAARLVGWQARLVGNPPNSSAPKYLTATGTQKSSLLFGLINAIKTTGPVVLVEGILDALKVGDNGLALLGCTISQSQCALIVRYFPGRPVVVMLDADAAAKAVEVQKCILAARRAAHDHGLVIIATPPMGKHDPGECTTAELAAAVAAALKQPA